MRYIDAYDTARGLVEGTDRAYWTTPNTTLKKYALSCVRDLASYTRHLQRKLTLAVTAGTGEYTLPADCVAVYRVAFDEEKINLADLHSLRLNHPQFASYSADPRFYYVDELNRKIGLYPIPATGSVYGERDEQDTVADNRDGMLFTDADSPIRRISSEAADVDQDDSFVQHWDDGTMEVDRASHAFTADGILIGDEDGMVIDIGYGAALNEDSAVQDYVTANGLDIYYRAIPQDVNDYESPPLPGWAHVLVVYYLCWKMREAKTEFHDKQDADFWRSLYHHGKQRLLVRNNGRLPRGRAFRTLDGESWMSRVSRLPARVPSPEV